MKFLVADWGPERFREVMEKDYLGYALPDGAPPPPPSEGRRDHMGVHEQRDGLRYVGFAPRVGRMTASSLGLVADLAARYGSGRVRTTTEQKMVILDVPPDRTAALAAELSSRPTVILDARTAAAGQALVVLAKLAGCEVVAKPEGASS